MNNLTQYELEKWVVQMITPKTGVDIYDRSYRFRTYEMCFVGSECVTWLCKHGNISRVEAVEFMQKIQNMYAIRHVVDQHMFADDYLFFEFQTPILEFCFSPILHQGENHSF